MPTLSITMMSGCFTENFTGILATEKEGVAPTYRRCGTSVQECKSAIEIGTIVSNLMCTPIYTYPRGPNSHAGRRESGQIPNIDSCLIHLSMVCPTWGKCWRKEGDLSSESFPRGCNFNSRDCPDPLKLPISSC